MGAAFFPVFRVSHVFRVSPVFRVFRVFPVFRPMSSYSDQLAWAAKEAQKVLAPLADPTNAGDFTLSGTTYTGTMSIFDKVLVPTPNGYEEQRQLKIATIIDQFTSAPDPSTRPAIVAKGRTWRLTAVEPGAYHYVLTAVSA